MLQRRLLLAVTTAVLATLLGVYIWYSNQETYDAEDLGFLLGRKVDPAELKNVSTALVPDDMRDTCRVWGCNYHCSGPGGRVSYYYCEGSDTSRRLGKVKFDMETDFEEQSQTTYVQFEAKSTKYNIMIRTTEGRQDITTGDFKTVSWRNDGGFLAGCLEHPKVDRTPREERNFEVRPMPYDISAHPSPYYLRVTASSMFSRCNCKSNPCSRFSRCVFLVSQGGRVRFRFKPNYVGEDCENLDGPTRHLALSVDPEGGTEV